MSEHRCEGMIYSGNWPRQCTNKAKVCRDGKWFCTVHDPEYMKKKDKERKDKIDREIAVSNEVQRRGIAMIFYCENLSIDYMESHQAVEK